MRNYYKKLKKGFTLVELVVVIAVIAILAAVSVGAYFGITDSANSSNATQAQKAYKDLWLTYSLSRDFDISREAKDNALDFCMEYAPLNGPDYTVNYKIVSINDGSEVETEGQELREMKRQSNGNNIACNDAILFIIETNYPSWFLTCGQYIIETGPICKNNEELISSLQNSNRINAGQITDEFKPELEVVGTDEDGNTVRGYKHFKYTINVPAMDGAEAHKDTVYLEHGESLATDSGYADSYFDINGGGKSLAFQLLYKGTQNVYDKTTTIDLSKEYEINEDNLIDAAEFGKYHYCVEAEELDYKNLKGLDVNLDNYPICVVTASGYEEVSTPITKQDKVEDNIASTDYKWVYTNVVQTTYKITGFSNKYYSDFETFDKEYIGPSTPFGNLRIIFIGKNVVIDDNYTLDENSIVVLPKESMTTDKMNNEFFYKCFSITPGETGKVQKWKKPFKLFGSSSWEKDGAEQDHIVQGSISTKVDLLKERTYGDPVAKEYSGTLYSSLIINKGKTLTLKSNSMILVDGVLTATGSNYKYRTTATNRGEITNNGTIVLNNTDLVSFGPIYGKGVIDAKGDSEVIELIKIDDFGGGNFTAGCAGRTLLGDRALMPFYDYVLDGIQCEINFYPGSSLKGAGAINTGQGNTVINNFYIISPNANTLFKIENVNDDKSNANNCIATKSVILNPNDKFNNKQKITVKGTLTDGEVKIEMMDYSLESSKMYFVISNFDIHLVNGGNLTLSNGKNIYMLLPSSSIQVDAGATLTIGGSVEAAILSASVFDTVLEKVQTGKWKSDDLTKSANLAKTYYYLSILNDSGVNPIQLKNAGNIVVSGNAKLCADSGVNYEALEGGVLLNTSNKKTDNFKYEYAYSNESILVSVADMNIAPFAYVAYTNPNA